MLFNDRKQNVSYGCQCDIIRSDTDIIARKHGHEYIRIYNYRPVSNLVQYRKTDWKNCSKAYHRVNQYDLMEDLQSAYWEHHSTETALLKVKTDILNSMDNQEITC